MNARDARNEYAVRDATRTLASLEAQAEALRLDVGALRNELARVESEIFLAPGKLLREANERLVAAVLRARDAEANAADVQRRQMTFLATIAHELRNPLVPLRLAALMLDRARTDDTAHAALQDTIKGQVAQLTRLIGDLLDGTRLSTGQFRLERTMIDIGIVLDRAAETARPVMDERRQSFTYTRLEGKVMVLGDPGRLVQVFGNLLENSSKYTPEGGTISLYAAQEAGCVIVTIADNGIGITSAALPQVFEMFSRDAHAALMNHGGLGIGLAVVRELIKAHEGTVIACSAGKDRGSEFVVTLPVPPSLP